MNNTCPRCNAPIDATTRFCTNCGAVLAAQGPYDQPAPQSQVPPYAASNPGFYQQQSWSGQGGQIGQSGSSFGGSLGFGGQNDALMKKVLAGIVATIAITLVLLVLFGFLAFLIPGLRCLFFVFIILVFLIPWIIYVNIRNYIRRTVGRLWWFL
ncbi:MAG: zinc ribbon domain-containing protein [Chloroflexi bacterium]|nr:MAG: zinc ribbon domain-containing protein [Chloroflexota bacterium]